MTMKVLEKVTKMKELKSELNFLKKEMGTDMFDYVMSEFRKRGFVDDPRGENYKRSLYSPETGINIHIGNISANSVSVNVTDMVDGGMKWGTAYSKLIDITNTGTTVSFVYIKDSFEKFYNTTLKNRVKRLNELLAV